MIAARGLRWLPVASITASASATREVATPRLPDSNCTLKCSVNAVGSSASAPASRAIRTWRSLSSYQLASSPRARATRQASQSQGSASVVRDRVLADVAEGSCQRRDAHGVALRDQQGEAIQEEIERLG